MKLKGKTAIVTGAGNGIGRAIAIMFAKEGADIVVADVDLQAAGKVANEIGALGFRAQAIKCDVSSSREVGLCVKGTLDKFNRIDILVNNAGMHKMAPSEELSEADWDRIMDVNLKGQFLCSQAVARQMIKQGKGKIINLASTAAHRAMPSDTAYAVSKAGVLHLTRQLAVDWAKYNINVNSVTPGTTLTAMSASSEKMSREIASMEERVKAIPLGRANTPEDIAGVVLFLASPESDNVTGQDISVDGGTCALHPSSVPVMLRKMG